MKSCRELSEDFTVYTNIINECKDNDIKIPDYIMHYYEETDKRRLNALDVWEKMPNDQTRVMWAKKIFIDSCVKLDYLMNREGIGARHEPVWRSRVSEAYKEVMRTLKFVEKEDKEALNKHLDFVRTISTLKSKVDFNVSFDLTADEKLFIELCEVYICKIMGNSKELKLH